MTNTVSQQELDALWVRYAGRLPSSFDDVDVELRADASLDVAPGPVQIVRDPRLEQTRKLRLSRWTLDRPELFLSAFQAGSWPQLEVLIIDSHRGLDGALKLPLGDLSKIWTQVPRLQQLVVVGAVSRLGPPDAARLEQLQLWLPELAAADAKDFARARLPALQDLDLMIRAGSWPALNIWTRATLPRLRTLALGGDSANPPLAELLAGDLLDHLEVLKLQFPNMSAEVIARLTSSIERFAALKRVELDDNKLSPSMCRDLQKRLPQLVGCIELPRRMADHLSPRSRHARRPVSELEMSVASTEGLRKAGIKTIGELAAASPETLMDKFGMQRRSIRELRELLSNMAE